MSQTQSVCPARVSARGAGTKQLRGGNEPWERKFEGKSRLYEQELYIRPDGRTRLQNVLKSDTAQYSLKIMNVERQSRDTLYRMKYDFDTPSGEVRPLGSGEGANPTAAPTREQQAFAAWKETLNWEERILENIAHRYNLERACQRVKSNKGAPGIDGMTVEELERWLSTHMADYQLLKR